MANTHVQDAFGVKGALVVWKIYDDGRRELVYNDHNMIVNTARDTFQELLAQVATGTNPEENSLHSMWFEASATSFANPVLRTDTGPVGTVAKRYTFTASDVDLSVGGVPGLIEYRGLVEKSEANGQTLRAAGLYTRGDNADPALANGVRLFARQIFGAVEKTQDFALEVRWRIQMLLT